MQNGYNETIALIGLVIVTLLSMYLLEDAQIVNSVVSGLIGYVGGRALAAK